MDCVTYMRLNGESFFASGEVSQRSNNPFDEPVNPKWYETEQATLEDNNMGFGWGDYNFKQGGN